MSLGAFQRAYADLAASPALCLSVRADPEGALASYPLTDRERGRLARAVWQRGMDANCSLYRTTRITALNSVAPLTLSLLKPWLCPLLDRYWFEHPVHEVRFAAETARFLAHLKGVLADNPGCIAPLGARAVADLAAIELAVEEVRLEAPTSPGAPPPETRPARLLQLGHQPGALLAAARDDAAAFAALPSAPMSLVVTIGDDGLPALFAAPEAMLAG